MNYLNLEQVFKSDNFPPEAECETEWIDLEGIYNIRDLLFKYDSNNDLTLEIKYKTPSGYETSWTNYIVLPASGARLLQNFLSCGHAFKLKFKNLTQNIINATVNIEGIGQK